MKTTSYPPCCEDERWGSQQTSSSARREGPCNRARSSHSGCQAAERTQVRLPTVYMHIIVDLKPISAFRNEIRSSRVRRRSSREVRACDCNASPGFNSRILRHRFGGGSVQLKTKFYKKKHRHKKLIRRKKSSFIIGLLLFARTGYFLPFFQRVRSQHRIEVFL